MVASAVDDILRAEPRAVGHLAASDRETWKCLVGHIDRSEACPPVLVRALLAIDDLEGWRRRIFSAFRGLNPDDGLGADDGFRRWFAAGIVRHLPRTDPAALGLSYRTALDHVEADAAKRAADLAVEIEEAGDSAQHRSLLGRALLLLARRLGEDGDHEGASAAARRADAIFAKLGDADWQAQAMRVRAGALLRLRKLDEALALVDTLFRDPPAGFPLEGGVYRLATSSDPVALAEAATIVLSATKDNPAWIRALGSIAESTGHRGCAERFEAGRRSLAEPDRALRSEEVDVRDRDDRII